MESFTVMYNATRGPEQTTEWKDSMGLQDSHVLNTFQLKNTTFTFRDTQLEITPPKNHK